MATAISSFTRHILPDVPGCPSFVIEEKVVEALQQFCKDTKILNKGIEVEDIDYSTVDSTDNDSIDVDLSSYVTGIAPVSISEFQIDGAPYDLEKMELVNDNSNLENILKDGVKFFTIPDEDTITIFPFTDQAVNFDIYLRIVFKPKDGITTIDDFFYDDYREAICAHAKSEIQRMKDKAWTNLDHATINAKTYSAKMGEAKISVENGFITGRQQMSVPFFC
jgi:hypothetical protein